MTILFVNSSDPAQFQTIAAAIAAANAGDTIQVASGTYEESFTIDKAITLIGPNSNTPAGGKGLAPKPDVNNDNPRDNPEAWIKGTITVAADDVTIDGFRLRHEGGPLQWKDKPNERKPNNFHLLNNYLTGYTANNSPKLGDANSNNPTSEVKGWKIEGNFIGGLLSGGGTGGAMYLAGLEDSSISNNTFWRPRAAHLYLASLTEVTIADNFFYHGLHAGGANFDGFGQSFSGPGYGYGDAYGDAYGDGYGDAYGDGYGDAYGGSFGRNYWLELKGTNNTVNITGNDGQFNSGGIQLYGQEAGSGYKFDKITIASNIFRDFINADPNNTLPNNLSGFIPAVMAVARDNNTGNNLVIINNQVTMDLGELVANTDHRSLIQIRGQFTGVDVNGNNLRYEGQNKPDVDGAVGLSLYGGLSGDVNVQGNSILGGDGTVVGDDFGYFGIILDPKFDNGNYGDFAADLDILNNIITGWEVGIVLLEGGQFQEEWQKIDITGNTLTDNSRVAIFNGVNAGDAFNIGANDNFFGSPNGPGEDGANDVGPNVLVESFLTRDPFTGVAIDGYISGATVTRLNGSGGSVTTDTNGRFSLAALGGSGVIRAIGGTDVSTGQEFKGELQAPGNATVLTPLTTLVVAVLGGNAQTATAADIQAATEQVRNTLKLPAEIDLLNDDPIDIIRGGGVLAAAALEVQRANVQVGSLLQAATGTEAGFIGGVRVLAQQIQAGETIDLTSAEFITNFLESAQQAGVTLSDAAQDNTANFAQRVAGDNNTIATATDLNAIAQTQAELLTETIGLTGAPIEVPILTITSQAVDTDPGTSFLIDFLYTFTFTEAVTGFTRDDITVTNGTKETFTGNDGDKVYTLLVTSNVVDRDAPGDTGLRVAVEAGAATGNISQNPSSPASLLAPAAPVINLVAGDDRVNRQEQLAGFDITGTGTPGAEIILRFDSEPNSGRPAKQATVQSDGTWSIAITAEDVQGFDQGAEGIFVYQVLNGNVSPQRSRFINVDTVLPTVSISRVEDSNGFLYTFTFSEAVTGFTADDITVTNGTKEALTGNDGDTVYTWLITPGDNFTGQLSIAGGAAFDTSGNPSVAATDGVPVDPNIVPILTITSQAVNVFPSGSPDYQFPIRYTFTFTEAVNGFTGDDITVTNGTKGIFTGSNGEAVYTLLVTSNVVTRDGSADTGLGVAVGAGAATGNISQNPSAAASLLAPAAPVINLVAGDDRVNRQELDGFNITGTGTPGAEIILRFDSEPNSGRPAKQATVQSDGTWSIAITAQDVEGFDQGEEGVFVYQVLNGNVSPQRSRFINVDTVPPTVSINSIGGADSIISGVAGDNTVVGRAEPRSGNVTIRLENTELGTTAVDENGNFTYSLTTANLQTIGQGTGKILTATQTDLAGNIGTSAPFTFTLDEDPGTPGEPGTVTITDPNTGTPLLQQPFNTVFKFSITGSTPSSQVLEVVFADGRTQSILTTLGNASGLPNGINSVLNDLQSGLISISSENGNVTRFQLRQVGTGTITPLTISQVTANGFTLTGSDFNITAEVLGSPDTVIISTQKIEVDGDELEAISLNNLDTSNVTGERITVRVDATLYREAAFDNLVGFYLADKTTGAVVDKLTGDSIAGVGDRNAYLDAVRNNAVLTGRVANNQTTNLSSTFEVDSSLNLSGYVLLPFLVANGDLNSVRPDFSNLFVTGVGTNVSNSDQIRLLGNNVFGFEDLAGGGDNDFDDVVFQVRGLTVG